VGLVFLSFVVLHLVLTPVVLDVLNRHFIHLVYFCCFDPGGLLGFLLQAVVFGWYPLLSFLLFFFSSSFAASRFFSSHKYRIYFFVSLNVLRGWKWKCFIFYVCCYRCYLPLPMYFSFFPI